MIRYFGGRILTMTGLQADSVTVSDGVIVGVNRPPQGEKQVDLRGRTLMPAFIDAHGHFAKYADALGCIELGGVKSADELVARLKKDAPQTGFVIGYSYDHNDFAPRRHPTKEELDAAFPDRPVLVSHSSGHMGVANSAALRYFGIDETTRAPAGGKIGRGADNKPNGYLEETAYFEYASKTPAVSFEQKLENLKKAQEIYLNHAVTTAQEGAAGREEIRLLIEADRRKILKLDVCVYADLGRFPQFADEFAQYIGRYVGHVKIGGGKIFLDGSLQGRTAYMLEPYAGGGRGYPSLEPGQVEEYVHLAERRGFQLLAHCNGDAACEMFLAAHKSKSAYRNVIIHAQTITKNQLNKAKELGVIPSFFASHTKYFADTHIKNLGWRRASKISPLGSAQKLGLPYTIHMDSPVLPPDMLEAVSCAACRTTLAGRLLARTERVSVEDALAAVTKNAAYSCFEENEKGTIQVGKRAQFALLDRDPLAEDASRLAEIKTTAVL